MATQTFKNTQIDVSTVGFGTLRLDALSASNACDLMLYAHQNGINFFDTAPDYANGKSQELAGNAFAQMQKKFYVSAKYGRIPQPYETQDDFLNALQRSLKQLHVETIDFYHLWNISSYDHWLLYKDEGGLFDGALAAQKSGMIRQLCITTTLDAQDLQKVLTQVPQISSAMTNLNPLNLPTKQDFLHVCHTMGVGVIASSPLLGGILPKSPDLVVAHPGYTIAQSALRCVMAQPHVNVALGGFSNTAQIDQAIATANNLDDSAIQNISSAGLPPLCTNCQQCRFCFTKTPIPQLMSAYNLMILSGEKKAMVDDILHVQHLEKRDARKCIGCKLCHQICPQSIPISERISQIIACL